WEGNLELVKDLFEDVGEPRAQMMLFHGEPQDKKPIRCADFLKPLELWYYENTLLIRGSFFLVFYRQGTGKQASYELWSPGEGLYPLLAPSVGRTPSEQEALGLIANGCLLGGQVVDALSRALDWQAVEESGRIMPDPGEEWLRTFVAYSTDLPQGAATFDAAVEVSFPGRYQSRTLLQGLVAVPLGEARISDLEEHPSYNFVVDGEILLKDQLFEHFRYRFNLSAGQTEGDTLPLAFQRYLRPGKYILVLKVEDLNQQAFFSDRREIEVPRLAQRPRPEPAVALTSPPPASAPTLSTRLLSEANTDLPTGDHTVQLIAPQGVLVTGRVRVEALTRGEGIARVRFDLNGRPVFTKSRPPYSVELNLGDAPRIHSLRATALGPAGNSLAVDEVAINTRPHRFKLRLIEPQAGKRYAQSVRAHAEVQVPEGERLDRVEFYLNDTQVASLYQPPFVQPIVIDANQPLAYVRAVAYLADGGTAEDVVFVNAPDYVDTVDVDLVELYVTALNRRGHPVEDLTREEVVVEENGVPQTLRRFERVTDVPIHAGILLDVSNSMTERLRDAVDGALRFFETVLTPKDRAAVITFNEEPHLAVRFTSSLEVLAGGLAGLTAEGETALYDSLIYSLYYFSGITGKRAIVLLSDGEDVRSRYTFEDVIEYARRSGVAIYTVGISLSGSKNDVRLKLQTLADETGGSSFQIDAAYQLGKVYEAIEEELRSQYLLSYQSTSDDDAYRPVEIKVQRPGVSAKSISGYYP
ncbi:MAG: VWA domain-containing protein, partial [Acidobacteria bacterium]|nr:VWA domain-containing protein [Acidobacteriota bacterium]